MVSTMELYTLGRILELAPELRRGWTYPKVTKDWTSKPWAKPAMPAALVGMRYRLPGLAAEKLPKIDVSAMWVYHPLVSARLARICKLAGVELIAWTVDDETRMRKLVAMGVDGLCSNDPRLFARIQVEAPIGGQKPVAAIRPCRASPSAGRCGRPSSPSPPTPARPG